MGRIFGSYSLVMPASITAKNMKEVPNGIVTPDYYKTRVADKRYHWNGEIKNEEQINGMRTSCRLARKVLDSLKADSIVKVGTTTEELDDYVHDFIVKHGAYPSPLNYRGFPKSVCTSVNNVACHGIPDSRPLLNGDIINIDVAVFHNGFHGDCSAMFLVGHVDDQGRHLIRVTLEALNRAIEVCKPGQPFSAIGNTIEAIATKNRLHVVKLYAGHGIGNYFHEGPEIVHFANNYKGTMAPGMTFTIEPILSQGNGKVETLEDGWTTITTDGARTAQWEHTILITDTGMEVLTGPDFDFPHGYLMD